MNVCNGRNIACSQSKKVSDLRLFLLVSLLYIICIFLYFYPYFDNLTNALIGPPEDNMQDFWNTWYSQITLDTNPKRFFYTDIIQFPDGTPLYYHSFAYTNLFIIFILRKLLHLPAEIPLLVFLHNAMLLLSFYLAAIGGFYLTRRFTKCILSGLLGGFIFAFSPFHVAHFLHHMGVSTIQYIPFFVYCFLSFVDTRKLSYIAGSIVFYALSALSSWYYLFYIGYFLIFYYTFFAIEERKFFVKRLFFPILANIVGVIIILLPLLVPMLVEGLKGHHVYRGGHSVYVADLLGYGVFHPYHLLSEYSQTIYLHFTGNAWEKTVYLGLINIGLFAWAFVNRERYQIKDMKFLLWGMLFFMMFASGTYLHIFGVRVIPMPTGVAKLIPFLKNVRAPSRAVVFTYLFLGIGVALAIDAIINNYSNNKIKLSCLLIIICGLVFLDFYPTKLELTQVECPPAYNVIIEDDDHKFGILDLPKGYVQGNRNMMHQAACHGKPIVYAVISRKVRSTLIDRLEKVDMGLQRKQLTNNKVKYIVIHDPWKTEKYAQYIENYSVVYSDRHNIVFRVY